MSSVMKEFVKDKLQSAAVSTKDRKMYTTFASQLSYKDNEDGNDFVFSEDHDNGYGMNHPPDLDVASRRNSSSYYHSTNQSTRHCEHQQLSRNCPLITASFSKGKSKNTSNLPAFVDYNRHATNTTKSTCFSRFYHPPTPIKNLLH
eukprot:7666123-Ditylum_brightwellii.AAC.1